MSATEDNSQLEFDIKNLVITSLDLEDLTADDIDTDEALFSEGLGLDSIDALELGMTIQKQYKVKIDAQDKDVKLHFSSIRNLAKFIACALNADAQKESYDVNT